jgi:hypothetical protein
MNEKNVAYWIATLALGAFMAYNAFAYLTHNPMMMEAFARLGYPTYFPTILGVAKILGIIVSLVVLLVSYTLRPPTRKWRTEAPQCLIKDSQGLGTTIGRAEKY